MFRTTNVPSVHGETYSGLVQGFEPPKPRGENTKYSRFSIQHSGDTNARNGGGAKSVLHAREEADQHFRVESWKSAPVTRLLQRFNCFKWLHQLHLQ